MKIFFFSKYQEIMKMRVPLHQPAPNTDICSYQAQFCEQNLSEIFHHTSMWRMMLCQNWSITWKWIILMKIELFWCTFTSTEFGWKFRFQRNSFRPLVPSRSDMRNLPTACSWAPSFTCSSWGCCSCAAGKCPREQQEVEFYFHANKLKYLFSWIILKISFVWKG